MDEEELIEADRWRRHLARLLDASAEDDCKRHRVNEIERGDLSTAQAALLPVRRDPQTPSLYCPVTLLALSSPVRTAEMGRRAIERRNMAERSRQSSACRSSPSVAVVEEVKDKR